MARDFKGSYPTFASSSNIYRERYKEILRKGGKDIFNDKMFDSVDRLRNEGSKLKQTILFIQLPVFIYLVLLVSGTDVNLTVFGITATKNLREALIVISAGLAVWVTFINHQTEVLNSLLQARNERIAKGNADVLEVLNVAAGLELITMPKPRDDLGYRKLHLLAGLAFVLSFVALLGLALFTMTAIHLITLLEVYRHPNFGPVFTFGVIAFVVLADAITWSWLVFQSGIIPYRNYEPISRMATLLKSNPARANAIITQMMKRHRAKGWVRRLLTRPVLPKDI